MKTQSTLINSKRKGALLTSWILLACLPVGVNAAAMEGFFDTEEGINIVGAGVGQVPDYQGSDDYTTGFAPFGRYYFSGERYVYLLGPQLSLNIIDDKSFQFGPMLMYRFGRDNDVDDNVVKNMSKIDDAVEAGAFVAASYSLNQHDPRERLIFSADLLADVSDTHDGWISTVGVKYWMPVSQAVVMHVGGGFAYASDDYVQTYYGVTGTDVALFPSLGGNAYNADGGINDYRLTAGAVMHLSSDWHLGVGVRYQGLQGMLKTVRSSPSVVMRTSGSMA